RPCCWSYSATAAKEESLKPGWEPFSGWRPLTRLAARSLATWTTGESALILHDLQRDLIYKRREKDLPGLHLRLLQACSALLKLPDTYAWRWIAYHLVEADRKDDLRR